MPTCFLVIRCPFSSDICFSVVPSQPSPMIATSMRHRCGSGDEPHLLMTRKLSLRPRAQRLRRGLRPRYPLQREQNSRSSSHNRLRLFPRLRSEKVVHRCGTTPTGRGAAAPWTAVAPATALATLSSRSLFPFGPSRLEAMPRRQLRCHTPRLACGKQVRPNIGNFLSIRRAKRLKRHAPAPCISVAFRLIVVPASAFETGHPFLAPSAAS
jgi:hypothetical protein